MFVNDELHSLFLTSTEGFLDIHAHFVKNEPTWRGCKINDGNWTTFQRFSVNTGLKQINLEKV